MVTPLRGYGVGGGHIPRVALCSAQLHPGLLMVSPYGLGEDTSAKKTRMVQTLACAFVHSLPKTDRLHFFVFLTTLQEKLHYGRQFNPRVDCVHSQNKAVSSVLAPSPAQRA